MMSTEHDFRQSSQQMSDLGKYFEAVNRSRTPWIIFSGHRYLLELVKAIVMMMCTDPHLSDTPVSKLGFWLLIPSDIQVSPTL